MAEESLCPQNQIITTKNSNGVCKNISSDEEVNTPPDGGARAWLVMVGSFLCNGILFGVINTYSVIYLTLHKRLTEAGDTEASSKAALVGSLTIGTTFFLSSVAGILTDFIGLRKTTLLGGLLAAGGMFLSSFLTHSIGALYLTYGVMYGLGAALAYTPSLAILGHYFKRYLGLVNGIVTAGSSTFTVIMPIVLERLVHSAGLEVTLRVLALISSFVIFCALLFKPIKTVTIPKSVEPKKTQLSFKETFNRFVNVDNWKKKKYVIWALAIPSALFGYFVPYVHMAKFVEDTFEGESGNLPVICIGITSGLGRLIFGYIADMPRVDRILLQQISFVSIGVLTICLPFTTSFNVLLAIALAMGLFDGCFISLLGPIAFDICGQKGATQAIGFLLSLCSIPLTVGPPIAGMIYDSTKSYQIPFILAGIPPIIGAILMCFVRCVKDEEPRETTRDASSQPLAEADWQNDNSDNIKIGNGFQKDESRKDSLPTAGIWTYTSTPLLTSQYSSKLVSPSYPDLYISCPDSQIVCTNNHDTNWPQQRCYNYSIL